MRSFKITLMIASFLVMGSGPAWSHFGMVIPSDSMVMQDDSRTITLTLSFSHPFDMKGMTLVKPKVFNVLAGGKMTALRGSLEATTVMGHRAWKAAYRVNRPGVLVFFMEPDPYWEPAEDSFIMHTTKTVVGAFGNDEGWDVEIGLKTEIVPLSRPFGLYAGNVFQGIVKLNGNPVPFARVEVEYYNRDNKILALNDYMITQSIKADRDGVFTYAAPFSGWWGFAALTSAEYKLSYQGEKKSVELGAVIWVYFHDPR